MNSPPVRRFNRIFSIGPDVEHFLLLQEAHLELAMQLTEGQPLTLSGDPLADCWVPLALEWLIVPEEAPQRLQIPDIAALGATALVASAAATTLLRPGLQGTCEFLPVQVGGAPWYLLNVLNKQPALDAEQSVRKVRRDGQLSRIFRKVVLKAGAVNDGRLFKVPGLGGPYCTDQPDSLFSLADRHRLTGLDFIEAQYVDWET